MMTGVAVLAAYNSEVPGMATKLGAPTYSSVSLALLRETVAVCGIVLAITASCACGVPATESSTLDFGLSDGIFLKSAGSVPLGTNVHGPYSVGHLNHRPEISK